MTIRNPILEEGTSLDLMQAREALREHFADAPPRGYLPGKTQLRDALLDARGCSALRAEEIVDALELRGFIAYPGTTAALEVTPSAWQL